MNLIFTGIIIFVITFLLLSWFAKTSSKKIAKGLRNLGYECIPSEGNFISFNSNGKGQKLFEDLLNEGVIVRTLGVYKMPNYLRVTIGLPEENSIFLEKLSALS